VTLGGGAVNMNYRKPIVSPMEFPNRDTYHPDCTERKGTY